MTKKDYIVIAKALKEAWAECEDKADLFTDKREGMIDALATAQRKLSHALYIDNPKFNQQKFRDFINK